MPLYEYECDVCGHRFEVIQKFADAPIETCPSCGGPVRKLQSAPAFQFKGSGWYVTDYARKDQGKETAPEGGSADAAKESTEKTDRTGTTDKAGTTDRAGKATSEKTGSERTGSAKTAANG